MGCTSTSAGSLNVEQPEVGFRQTSTSLGGGGAHPGHHGHEAPVHVGQKCYWTVGGKAETLSQYVGLGFVCIQPSCLGPNQ